MKYFYYVVNNRKSWAIILLIVCGAFFWFGYRQTVKVNRVELPPPTNQAPKVPREYNPGDSLLDFKIERDRERSREVERIQSLLDKVGLSDQVRKEAEEELWRLTQATSKEHELENLLMAKGIKECMATVGRKLVTVAVVGQLRSEDAKNIAITSAEVTGYQLDQIQILER